jgi:hypothetical protein
MLLISPDCSCVTLPLHGLGQLSVGELSLLAHPCQAKVNCTLHLFGHQFCPGVAICPSAALDSVVPLRTVEVLHSPVGVADFLGWNWVSFGRVQVDR